MASLVSPTATEPCHICQRRPSTRQDLPSYLDCEVCSMRTCYICVRTCEGPQCQTLAAQKHSGLGLLEEEVPAGRRVCASCCVEVGSEGMVWCHDCYKDDTELELYNPKRTKEELEVESAFRIADWLHRTHSEEPGSSPPSFLGDPTEMDC